MDSHLQEVLMPISIIGSFGLSVYFFVKVMTDYILKKKMIDKGFVNEDTQAIFKDQQSVDNKHSSLKWGLIILAGGLALVILEFVDVRRDSPLPFGLLAVFIAAGFLTYYFLVQRNNK